jgi:hypothetical protein
VITKQVAFLVLKKWLDDKAPLRVDVNGVRGRFSVVCVLDRICGDTVALRIGDSSFIELYLEPVKRYEYVVPKFDREGKTTPIEDGRVMKKNPYEMAIVAFDSDTTFTFMELAETDIAAQWERAAS